ncbi:hypothetical protein GCM10008111_32170 [Alishewanella tabrizica]|uniref:DUF2971 domain-containing protein n=2 Tax=Alishewanella tabrizica TaxID=671278 RepID=A0ABQ2WVQ3_9ALTE|nr:hypothetical protein GCM10008111_32170 [Alishewanella tabrizica]
MKSVSSKTFDFVNHELEVDKIIRSKFNDSQMSNAKWKKLFMLISVNCPEIYAIWKFIDSDSDGVGLIGSPEISELEDTYINHKFWFGPRYYKEIQWLSFPKIVKKAGFENVPVCNTVQNTDFLLNELNKVGHWPIEETNNGFTIFGHR